MRLAMIDRVVQIGVGIAPVVDQTSKGAASREVSLSRTSADVGAIELR